MYKPTEKDINLWRMNIHTHESVDKQIETFNFCKSKNILGIGWETLSEISNIKVDIDMLVEQYCGFNKSWNDRSFKMVLNAYYQIKKDDLIWTRSGSKYYLCRVLDKKYDYIRENLTKKEQEEHDYYDIWHGIECEILEVGTEEKINGTIVNSFNAGTICKIRKNNVIALNFSKHLYNKITKTNYYDVIKIDTWDDFWSNVKASQLEEIVILYLQIKKNYGIYSDTCKNSTKTHECILFSKTNYEVSYVQVKEGAINIEESDYKNIYKDHKFYFYSNKNQYGKYQNLNDNIIIITRSELQEFIVNNKEVVKHIGWPLINL